jgi:hypothetical protein
MSLVNKHRLRLFNQDNNDLLLYSDEQVSLQAEIRRLSELELELRDQKQYKETQLEIALANQAVNIDNNDNNNIDNSNNIVNNIGDNHVISLVQIEEEQESDIRFNIYMINMQF